MGSAAATLELVSNFSDGLIDEFGTGGVDNNAIALYNVPSSLASLVQSNWFIAQWGQPVAVDPSSYKINDPSTYNELYGNALYSWTDPGATDSISLYANNQALGGGDVLQLSDGVVQSPSIKEDDIFLSSPNIPVSQGNLANQMFVTFDAKITNSITTWIDQQSEIANANAGAISATIDVGFTINFSGAGGVSARSGFVQIFPWNSLGNYNPNYENGATSGFISSLLLGSDPALPLLPSDANALPDTLSYNVNEYVYDTLYATYANANYSAAQQAALLNLSNWNLGGMYIGLATTVFPGNGTTASPETTTTLQLSDISLVSETGESYVDSLPPANSSVHTPTVDTNPQISYDDLSENVSGTADGGIYSGSLINIQNEYMYNGYDYISLTAPSGANWYFGGGYGQTMLTATEGNNVLVSSMAGSIMNGGYGDDTFVVQEADSDFAASQNTIGYFHVGDQAIVQGIGGTGWTYEWSPSGVTPGNTGLTLVATNATAGLSETITFASLTISDLNHFALSTNASTGDLIITSEANSSLIDNQSGTVGASNSGGLASNQVEYTVIGGVSGHTLTGLVSFSDNNAGSVIGALQTQLNLISGAVTANGTGLTDVNITAVPSGIYSGTGIAEFTNANANGSADSTSGGTPADFLGSVGSGYTSLVVEAPGDETIRGSGASNFLAMFSTQSNVTFYSEGGSGTVVASAGNTLNLSGNSWTLLGSSLGGDTVNTFIGTSDYITTGGSGNLIGLGGATAIVASGGGGDLVIANSGSNIVSLGGANSDFEMQNGNDTVYATAGSSSINAFFFNGGGGTLDFINGSNSAASVTGGADGGSGSTTAFGGAGGGFYNGGAAGNNSLVGGSGTVTLVGAGANNFLSVVGGNGNALFAGAGNATLVGGVGSTNDLFDGGLGTDSVVSYGQGTSSFFLGSGVETLIGSMATGAVNNYYFNQNNTSGGGGLDYILNFNYSSVPGVGDTANITGGATIGTVYGANFNVNGTQMPSTVIGLSDNTEIRLIGVTLASAVQASIIGGTSF